MHLCSRNRLFIHIGNYLLRFGLSLMLVLVLAEAVLIFFLVARQGYVLNLWWKELLLLVAEQCFTHSQALFCSLTPPHLQVGWGAQKLRVDTARTADPH